MINFRAPRAFRPRFLVLMALICGSFACQTQKPPDGPEPPPEGVQPVPDEQEQARAKAEAQVEELLIRATLAMEEDRMTFPEEGSALQVYRQALTVDPGNQAAKRGLEQIVERYVELALAAADRRKFGEARSMLARARLVDAGHPAIEPTTEQLRLLLHAKREKLILDKVPLRDREASVRDSLILLGAKARMPACRITISARNDAEGRWIYQQLSQADGERRIRAKIQLASPPSVELICFEES